MFIPSWVIIIIVLMAITGNWTDREWGFLGLAVLLGGFIAIVGFIAWLVIVL